MGLVGTVRIETFSAQFLNRSRTETGPPIPSATLPAAEDGGGRLLRLSLSLFLLLSLRLGFLLKQRLPVSDRDLVVIRMDF